VIVAAAAGSIHISSASEAVDVEVLLATEDEDDDNDDDDPFGDMEDLLNEEPAAEDELSADGHGFGSDEPADDVAALEAMLG
jgi:hypothetical protein